MAHSPISHNRNRFATEVFPSGHPAWDIVFPSVERLWPEATTLRHSESAGTGIMMTHDINQIVVYSTVGRPDCQRARRFLGDQRIPDVNIDIEQDPEAMAYVERVNYGPYWCVTTRPRRFTNHGSSTAQRCVTIALCGVSGERRQQFTYLERR
jgi:glutaredoxin